MISMNLYVKSISKSIKGEKVLDDISYTFESGKIYGIYGKNGSGKQCYSEPLQVL